MPRKREVGSRLTMSRYSAVWQGARNSIIAVSKVHEEMNQDWLRRTKHIFKFNLYFTEALCEKK